MKKEVFLIGAIIIVSVVAAYTVFPKAASPSVGATSPTPLASESPTEMTSSPQTTLANPASQNCAKLGGQTVIQKRGDGGEYGLCQFEDNMACEEWALFRGECPVGGRKTIGYDTIQQSYCAWLGGQTLAEPNAQCTLPNGKICPVDTLYNGTCS